MTQHIAEKTNQEIFVLFVNLSAAFNHINRDWLFQLIRNRLPGTNKENKIINIIKNLCKQTSTELQYKSELCFETSSGVCQGGPESLLTYTLIM